MQTRSAWLEGAEVTEVWFDPTALPLSQLLQKGMDRQCAQQVWTTTDAQWQAAQQKLGSNAHKLVGAPRADKEPKYYLLHSPLRFVPMTSAQAARCNAALAPNAAGKPERWLSSRQKELVERIGKEDPAAWPIAIDVSIEAAWQAVPVRR